MPDYYSNSNPASSFAEGLERGFNLVEGIRDRRRQRDLQDEQMQLQRNQDARAQTSADLSNEAARNQLEYQPQQLKDAAESNQLALIAQRNAAGRIPIENARSDIAAQQQTDMFNLNKKIGEANFNNAKADRAANESFSQGLAERLYAANEQPQTLAAVGRAGVAQAPPANYVERNAPPSAPTAAVTQAPAGATSAAVEPAGDLRAAPTILEAAGNAAVGAGQAIVGATNNYRDWYNKTNFENAAKSPTLYHANIEQIASDPKGFERYNAVRSKMTPSARSTWDVTFKGTLNDQLKQLPTTLKNAPRIRELTDQLKQLTNAQAKSIAEDTAAKKPIGLTDPNLSKALAPMARPPESPAVMTLDQYRADNIRLGAIQKQGKATKENVEWMAKGLASGRLTPEMANNMALYNTPLAPAAAKLTMNANYAAIQRGNRIDFIDLTNGKNPQAAEAARKGTADMVDLFKSMRVAGQLDVPKGAELAKVTDGLNFLRTPGAAERFKELTNIDPRTADGKDIDPANVFRTERSRQAFADMTARDAAEITDSRESTRPGLGPEALSSMPAAAQRITVQDKTTGEWFEYVGELDENGGIPPAGFVESNLRPLR